MPSNCSSSIQRDLAQLANIYYSCNEVITRNATENPVHALTRKKATLVQSQRFQYNKRVAIADDSIRYQTFMALVHNFAFVSRFLASRNVCSASASAMSCNIW